jgi:hypothetical protein
MVENDKRPKGNSLFVMILVVGAAALLPPGIRLLVGWPRRREKGLLVALPADAPPRRRPGRRWDGSR